MVVYSDSWQPILGDVNHEIGPFGWVVAELPSRHSRPEISLSQILSRLCTTVPCSARRLAAEFKVPGPPHCSPRHQAL